MITLAHLQLKKKNNIYRKNYRRLEVIYTTNKKTSRSWRDHNHSFPRPMEKNQIIIRMGVTQISGDLGRDVTSQQGWAAMVTL